MSVDIEAPGQSRPGTESGPPNTGKRIARNGKARIFTVVVGADGSARIPTFDTVQVSTMTIIAHTNLIINTDKFYKYIPWTDWTLVKKKRGRKKKVQPEDPNRDVPPGSIISLTKKRYVRGAVLKPKKKKSKTFFRHSVSVVMILEGGKMLNVKISRNGKLQMTGCKTVEHAVEFMKHMYSHMIETEEWTGETLFTYKTDADDLGDDVGDDIDVPIVSQNPQDLPETEPILERQGNSGLHVIFRCVMKNIDFDIGYKIRRDLLNIFINKHTDFRSIFESSIGTSVNIKLKATERCDKRLTRLRITADGHCMTDEVTYEEFFNTLSTKDQKDERRKESYHTFLVFASGSIIMSSAGREMGPIFYKLVRLLIENREKIEEREGGEIDPDLLAELHAQEEWRSRRPTEEEIDYSSAP
jgi:hypothetical protein